jgi:hypothetical protein
VHVVLDGHFDSYLLTGFCEVLEEEGVRLIDRESVNHIGRAPIRNFYELTIELGGVVYDADVMRVWTADKNCPAPVTVALRAFKGPLDGQGRQG